LQPPRAPPDHLRLQSFQILSRLELIQQFRPWLEYTRYHVFRKHHTPLELLWDCFSFGAPVGTLLNLLGSPSPSHLIEHVEYFNFGIGVEEREAYFMSFIHRVQLLEIQRRLPYGEVLRCDDFLSDASSAFAKVLRTVYRLLVALEESYPGLFIAPIGSQGRRQELIQELVDTERAHISILTSVFDAATALSTGLKFMEPCLECFIINRTRLLQYHERLLGCTESIFSKTAEKQWITVFALDDDLTRTKVFGAYRSICINYLGLMEFLEMTTFEPELVNSARIVLESTSAVISRISTYNIILQDILDATLPSDDKGYNSLCEAVFRIGDISETMDEVGYQLRTMRSVRILKGRAYIWTAPDPEDLGIILLDDCLVVNPAKKIQYSVFLFETLLLCCREGFDRKEVKQPVQTYPIYSWEMGPALRKASPLDIVHAIPVSRLEAVTCPDTSSMEVSWLGNDHEVHYLSFVSMSYPQWDQWLTTLEPFVPPIYRPPNVPRVTFGEDEEPLSGTFPPHPRIGLKDEDDSGRMLKHAKSWSVIGRKGPRSESSSFVNEQTDDDLLISPGLLPNLFNPPEILRSPSPLSLTHALTPNDRPPTPPAEDGFGKAFGGPSDSLIYNYTNKGFLLDLTGKITREGRYPSAHGGFSDVWKGVWHDADRARNVAVKVLRSRIDDPEMEEKMIRRLRRELSIWKNLDHPHILGLHGTASDFGHYSSMVCPWMEHGSVSKHMERCGDIMSTSDRLKLLCEVADGLSYLHSRSIVHGDLTGSNILITDEGKACLCDFGLSTIVADFQGTSYFTSTIGGAVRWADALLYRIHEEGEKPPAISTRSDIYSFGSVMLEVLSGRIPYHYIRTDPQVIIELHRGHKPRRPAQSFVSNRQWSFIESCWSDDVDRRPDIEEVCRTMQTLYDVCSSLF
ncbi:TKL/TKL-ccin protein kinase, partial [Lyophyllum atratum]